MQDRKKNLMTSWDEDAWQEIWDVAASPHFGGGVHAKDVVQYLVILALDQLKTDGPVAKELGRIHARKRLLRMAQGHTTALEDCIKIAIALKDNPDEALYDQLMMLCN